MKTIVLGEPPVEIVNFLARRRALGQDRFDEVWEGDYHVVPAPHSRHGQVDSELAALLRPAAKAAGLSITTQFNLGGPHDYRVPDGGYHRTMPSATWMPTAAIVVEIVSPGDETWAKLDFYARHGVEEILVAEPRGRRIRWFTLAGATYEKAGASRLLSVTSAELEVGIDWPG